jgi:putative transposase
MTLWRTYYHLVWATHDRHPLILPAHEPILHEYLHQKIKRLDAHCYAIGGMPDHIHLIVSIPPKISIAEFVKHLKGGSSRHLNQSIGHKDFGWQREYGVFTLGGKQLERAIDYVKNQKHHHAESTIVQSLESVDELVFDSNPPRE